MRIFLTGATGFIGAALLGELISAGHEVVGLTRSEAGVRAIEAAGAVAYRGTLEDPESLRAGADAADAVIHTAFDHDFSRFVDNCAKDGRVIRALGQALAGSDRPLIITSGTGMGSPDHGALAMENVFNPAHPNPRVVSELTGAELLDAGINLSVMRLPQVHDTRKQGLITPLIDIFREKGVAAYVGEGRNRFSAGHLSDVVRLYRLAVERGNRGARYHAVAEEGIETRVIAEALGRGLGLPVISVPAEKAAEQFGWMSIFAGADMPASSAWTRKTLDWHPTGPTLMADLDAMDYGALAA
ncbi:NAD-dependent dehydratase [Xaviernesmea oryzae]|uniref:NAD-dependent dehydratase n=1 Tax=Xaviernesmea oryzae TaxID=464029 RepID=A0A1Q9AS47_9HYPH|nr:SDR family oxidoreductase [Xaviernesmea oryzae]OLP58115.1 NAD-dependent dehydratase [Xaviernesmea oryzae]SEL82415.1 Nucleoside-diphosphate-sugar epimerase [Xaviernesmea oryzae]